MVFNPYYVTPYYRMMMILRRRADHSSRNDIANDYFIRLYLLFLASGVTKVRSTRFLKYNISAEYTKYSQTKCDIYKKFQIATISGKHQQPNKSIFFHWSQI